MAVPGSDDVRRFNRCVLVAHDAQVNGGIRSFGADWLEVTNSSITGGGTITGTTRVLVLEDDTVRGRVRIYDNPAVD